VYDNLIGHDIDVNTIMAPRTLSRPPVGNGAAEVRQAPNAQFAERTLGPGSDSNPFDSTLSASAASFDVDLTPKGRGGP
jgi:hypothetical protein